MCNGCWRTKSIVTHHSFMIKIIKTVYVVIKLTCENYKLGNNKEKDKFNLISLVSLVLLGVPWARC